jgi:hypothetical protein
MAKLAAAFSVEVTPEKAEVYWDDLGDLPDAQFVVACTRARREWDKPFALPPIAVLLRYATEAEQAAGAIVDGETAWAAFRARVLARYSFGVTRAFDWPDELTRDVVRHHLGIDTAAVHTLATVENEFEREQYRRRFVAEYNARRGTARAAEVAGLTPPKPLRQVADGGD